MPEYRSQTMPYSREQQTMSYSREQQAMPHSREQNSDPMRPFALAMAYVPWQQWNQTYELKKAMCAGTIFPELDKRFLGKRGDC